MTTENAPAHDPAAAGRCREVCGRIRGELGKVIVGQDDVIEQVLIAILSRGHALLEGVPGVAKTLLVRSLAEATRLTFNRIQFTPDLMPVDITGTDILQETEEGRREFDFVYGPVFANIVLADEINRAPPKTQAAMLEAMQEYRVTVLGKVYPLSRPFLVLATQNPVDLDYKALSNIGSWFLGRLQTERDKMRVLDGLEGAAASSDTGFDRKQMEQLLAGLGARVFLLNNVHEDAPVVFHVRWVLSYLRGPLARRQIKELMDPKRKKVEQAAVLAAESAPAARSAKPRKKPQTMRPRLPKGADEYFVPTSPEVPGGEINYMPAVIRVGEVRFNDARKGIKGEQRIVLLNDFIKKTGEIDWNKDLELPNGLQLSQLARDPQPGASFAELPPQSTIKTKTWTEMKKDLVDWLYGNFSLTIYQSPLTGEYSQIHESEGDFRARLVHAAHEIRDEKIEELREKYEKKIKTLEDRIARAMDEVAEQQSQASSAKMDTAMRIGSSILGAVLGRRSAAAEAAPCRAPPEPGRNPAMSPGPGKSGRPQG